ncbi:MAG TPA: 6,7-dimethyl-8-ribityllumazine synthase [Cryomorphaceae bacterium]|nr:6,7-dimethyl-8-ribityllumazine synthase [Cryomorphaceae bacterium]
MATQGKNLSHLDKGSTPSAAPFRFGIVSAEWNAEITDPLTQGAGETLIELGARRYHVDVRKVPGSFELPIGAKLLIDSGNYDAIIAIGSVIQGETRHFEFVCQAVAQGVKDVSLQTGVPVIFCVLTDDTMEQAKARSGGKHGNKGVEAAIAAVKMAYMKSQLSKAFSGEDE